MWSEKSSQIGGDIGHTISPFSVSGVRDWVVGVLTQETKKELPVPSRTARIIHASQELCDNFLFPELTMYKQTRRQHLASRRNWAIYVLKCVRGNMRLFKSLLDTPDYARLENAVEWAIMEIERSRWKDV